MGRAVANWDTVCSHLTFGRKVRETRACWMCLAPDELGHSVQLGDEVVNDRKLVVLAVEIGPAELFAADHVLAAAAELLTGKPAVVKGRLVLRQWFQYGQFDADDLDRVVGELSRDATKLQRSLASSGRSAKLQDHFEE